MNFLEQILGCYFHQDWTDEFENTETVIRAIIELEPTENILSVVREIDDLLGSGNSESQLKEILVGKVGCYFDPNSIGMTYGVWLGKLRNEFAQVL